MIVPRRAAALWLFCCLVCGPRLCSGDQVRSDSVWAAAIAGWYRFAPGHLLSITIWPQGPIYTDYADGRAGVIFRRAPDELFSGAGFNDPSKPEAAIKVIRNAGGDVSGLAWTTGGTTRRAHKVSFPTKDIHFVSDGIALAGSLVLPQGKGPFPVVVRIPGAGPQTRVNVMDGYFADNGIACFSYDKRGTGESSGNWVAMGPVDIADDVLQAISALRRIPEVDGDRIGLEANSEGGWAAPLVVLRDGRLKFVVMKAAPVLSYREELLNEAEWALRTAGLSDSEVADALEFRRALLDKVLAGAGLTNEQWAGVQAFAAPYRGHRWFPLVGPAGTRGEPQEHAFRMGQLDTRDLWPYVRIPVLGMYGGMDANVPGRRNAEALQAVGQKAGNSRITVKFFELANHDGFDQPKRAMPGSELDRLRGFSPGYLSTELDWVSGRLERIEKGKE